MATSPIRQTIHHQSDIPSFQNEDEERVFWATHEVSNELADRAEPIPAGELPPPRPRPSTQPITIRIEGATLIRLKALAKRRNMPYQTLLKDFVIERLYEEEKREGVLQGISPADRRRRPPRDSD